jgi:hypothetical protein
MAVVRATPIRMASTFPISGKLVMRHKKYREVEKMEAEAIRRPI